MFRETFARGEDYNTWTFFATKANTQADGCSVPVLNDVSRHWTEPLAIGNPPWPHSNFTMPLFDEEGDCFYLSDGTNPGVLYCLSMVEETTVGCKEANERMDATTIMDCSIRHVYIYACRIVYCEW
jgi:hypothetical protein